MDALGGLFKWIDENKLLLGGVLGAIAGAILTKLVPSIWSGVVKGVYALLAKMGGRFAFKKFQDQYLNWVITEHKALRLAGVISTDDTKRPLLDQVFVSVTIGRREQKFDDETLRAAIARAKDLVQHAESWVGVSDLLRPMLRQMGLGDNELDQLEVEFATARQTRGRNIPASRDRFENAGRDDPAQRPRDEEIEEYVRLALGVEQSPEASGAISLEKLLTLGNRLALLGVPGAGKTTLLQYLALSFAHEKAGDSKLRQRRSLKKRLPDQAWRVPIFVSLGSIASMLTAEAQEGRSGSIIDVLPRLLPPDFQRDYGDLAVDYFRHHLERGGCILLLDGLDEVPSDNEFRAVVDAIESLALRYPRNLYVSTSRIAGWRSGIGADFRVLFVNELSDAQVRIFIQSWYDAVEKNSVIGRLEDEGKANREARFRKVLQRSAELQRTLSENIGIRRLATNPMLLSIIALVHRDLVTLPRERSKLYEQCTGILLEQWDIARGVRVDDTNLKLDQKQALMQRIAVAMHTGEIGDPGGTREAPRADVERVLGGVLPSFGREGEDSSRLLARLIERSGLITERRRGVVAFAHHTFQEYFAACYLANGERPDHRDYLLDDQRLFSDWWREVTLLYSGLLSDSSDFVGAIRAQATDNLTQERLRLAALCLAEAVAARDPAVRDDVLTGVEHVRTLGRSDIVDYVVADDLALYLTTWAREEDWHEAAALATLNAPTARTADQVAGAFTKALTDSRGNVMFAALNAIQQVEWHELDEALIGTLGSTMALVPADLRPIIIRALTLVAPRLTRESEHCEHILKLVAAQLEEEHIPTQVAGIRDLAGLARSGVVGEQDWPPIARFLNSANPELRQEAAMAAIQIKPQLRLEDLLSIIGLFNNERISYTLVGDLVDLVIANISPRNISQISDVLSADDIRAPNAYLMPKLQMAIAIRTAESQMTAATVDGLFNALARQPIHYDDPGRILSLIDLAMENGLADVVVRRLIEALGKDGQLALDALVIIEHRRELLGQPDLHGCLEQLRAGRDPTLVVRVQAILAAQSADRISLLLDLARNGKPEIRAAALAELSDTGSAVAPEDLRPVVIAGLNARSSDVRIAAIELANYWARHLTDEEVLATLISIVQRDRGLQHLFDIRRYLPWRNRQESAPWLRYRFGGYSFEPVGLGDASKIKAMTALAEFGAGAASRGAADCLLGAMERIQPTSTLYPHVLNALLILAEGGVTDSRLLSSVAYGAVNVIVDADADGAGDRSGIRALIALASRSPAPDVLDICQKLRHHEGPRVRELSLRLAGTLQGRVSTNILADLMRQALDDRDPGVRLAALEQAQSAMLQDDPLNLLPAVRKRLVDDQRDVRDAAWDLAHTQRASFRSRRDVSSGGSAVAAMH